MAASVLSTATDAALVAAANGLVRAAAAGAGVGFAAVAVAACVLSGSGGGSGSAAPSTATATSSTLERSVADPAGDTAVTLAKARVSGSVGVHPPATAPPSDEVAPRWSQQQPPAAAAAAALNGKDNAAQPGVPPPASPIRDARDAQPQGPSSKSPRKGKSPRKMGMFGCLSSPRKRGAQ
eukprot:COSAG01_NODE_13047_length_1644_cov_2.584466_1_plen_180_part_00